MTDNLEDDAVVMSASSIPRQSDCAGIGLDAGVGLDDAGACADGAGARRLAAPTEPAAAAVRVVEAEILCW